VTLAFAPLLMDCGGGMPGVPGGMPGGCPANIADAQAVMSANFGLQGELEGKVKAALAAGANLQKLAVDVEAEVATACGNLAKDLGATDVEAKEEGPGKKAEAACQAAVKAIGAQGEGLGQAQRQGRAPEVLCVDERDGRVRRQVRRHCQAG